MHDKILRVYLFMERNIIFVQSFFLFITIVILHFITCHLNQTCYHLYVYLSNFDNTCIMPYINIVNKKMNDDNNSATGCIYGLNYEVLKKYIS